MNWTKLGYKIENLSSADIAINLSHHCSLPSTLFHTPVFYTHTIHRSILSIGCSLACIDHVCSCLFKEYDASPVEFAHTRSPVTHTQHAWTRKSTHMHKHARKRKRVPWDCLAIQSIWLTVSGIVPQRNISCHGEKETQPASLEWERVKEKVFYIIYAQQSRCMILVPHASLPDPCLHLTLLLYKSPQHTHVSLVCFVNSIC